MKTLSITLVSAILLTVSACHSTKKNVASTSAPQTSNADPSVSKTTTVSASTPASVKPANGVYAPGTAEVNAIILQHADVTLEKLTLGYTIYSKGECTSCHMANNIYRYTEVQWTSLLDDMAMRARISAAQKDAVYKYILAIKASKSNN
jgi:hypothetical protein